jgi:uncharacterized phage protein gp47/JayE
MTADPSTWGVQASGFVVPNADEIIQATNADLLAYVSPDFDTDPDSPDGQVDGIRARQLALLWETAGKIHDANNPDNAEGELLVEICKLSGTTKQASQPTTVTAWCGLASGTFLESGVAMASLTGHPDVLFTIAEDATATLGDGYYALTFKAVDPGPIVVPVHTLTVIATPITGWTSVDNQVAGTLGNNGDTDTLLRARRDAELSAVGSTTVQALRADIRALTDVYSCEVLTNRTDAIDANGLPAHTFEAVVYHAGTLVAATLAETIWNNQPAGIQSYGTTAVSFVDADGVTRAVYYTPVEQVPVAIAITLTTTTGYAGAVQFAADLANELTLQAVPGGTVYRSKVEATALSQNGIIDTPACTINGGSYLAIQPRQIATFAAGDITVS